MQSLKKIHAWAQMKVPLWHEWCQMFTVYEKHDLHLGIKDDRHFFKMTTKLYIRIIIKKLLFMSYFSYSIT